MIGTSRAELVFIRIAIFALHYSVPIWVLGLAVAVHVAVCAQQDSPGGPAAVAAWIFAGLLVAEAIHAAIIYLPFKIGTLRRKAIHPPPLTRVEREAQFDRCVANVPDPEHYLSLWFLGADAEDIKRENVREFMLWAFFDRDGGQMPLRPGESLEDHEAIEAEVNHYITQTESMLGRRFAPGRGKARSFRLTLDAIETKYHSVLWYAIVALVDILTHCALSWHGFQYRSPVGLKNLTIFPPRPQLLLPTRLFRRSSPSSELGYWYRAHTSRTKKPVVFLHGIGIGLWAYVSFLTEIGQHYGGDDGQVGVIALELLPISMRFTSAPLAQPQFLAHLTAILQHHGWLETSPPAAKDGAREDEEGSNGSNGSNGSGDFILVSHSYGSVLTTHVLRSPILGPRVAAAVLVDPVSILLHLPDVAFNFTRRRPRHANEWQLWFFASTDPGTAHALARHFFWRENVVWKEELVVRSAPLPPGVKVRGGDGDGTADAGDSRRRRKVAVCLAGRDLIVDTPTVAKYLVTKGDLRDLTAGDEATAVQLITGSNGPNQTTASTGGYRSRMSSIQDTRSGIEVLWFSDLDHAQVFDNKGDRAHILQVLSRYCAR